jgi:hypothetical protein
MKNMLDSIDASREYGYVPRVHPNGFLQLDLDPAKTQRLHIWDLSLPRQEVPTLIHDHEFDLESTVYMGCLINKRFRVEPADTEDGQFKKWTVQREVGSEETKLIESEDEFTAVQTTREFIYPQGIYTMSATEFHESGHIGPTVTVMKKLGYHAGHSASVLVPVGQQPDNDFRRSNTDVDYLWDMVYETVREV